ncbi:histidine kinase/DNA gyrase B/HSP90-like ATPase [Dysgonomonas alginatilytica]|uniref:histidine kinase n=1 Tax=Dysgonomonas alginatilytica TaxID=1605892 RepID=A0A2V3PH71_9BACT|nr:ATP-binding protein [Dysgonomonas alginatilytica]PXV57149.1 histidine kinase/DNA gyrase B/HSP90-like ATPase [Dysgonomonas alginatilytica]
MKKYNTSLIILIVWLIAVSIGVGASFVYGNYWLCSIFFLLVVWSVYRLVAFLKRTVKDMERLMVAIKFSEFNISFNGYDSKGLIPSLAMDMEKSIARFNKRIQEKEVENSFYDILLNRIDSAILVVNLKKQIVWINKASLDLFGKPQPRVLSDLSTISNEILTVLDKLIPGEIKTIKISNDFREYNLAITVVLINSKGEDLKIFSFKNIQLALDENENEAWIKLIRILTHEMMNSMTPIISLSETFSEIRSIEENVNSDMLYQAMQTIYRRSKGLVEFIRNYQKLTYISEPDRTHFTAKEVMTDICNLLRAENIYISFSIDSDNISLFADRIQIEQVLINLIKNAWDACSGSEGSGVEVRITKNGYQQPVISVLDDGCGILPDVLDKIFIPFFTTKKKGSGIGLSICRQIISSHGGSISVISEVDKGTCFTIKLGNNTESSLHN